MKDLVVRQNDYGISQFLANFNSEHTRRAYKKDIEIFFNYVFSRGRILQSPSCLQFSDFLSYRDHLLKTNTVNTASRRIATLKSLMTWFAENGHITTNPITNLKMPRAEVTEPTQAFSDSEVKRMLETPDDTTFSGNMHKGVMLFLFYFGLRRSEIVNIKMSDIYRDGETLVVKVRGKGGKVRILPFSEDCEQKLTNYLSNYENFTNYKLQSDDFLIQSRAEFRNTAPLNSSTIYKIIKQYSVKIGIDKKVSPHSCRATVITKAIEMGAVITDVADMAGHENIHTTQGYWKKRKALEDSPIYKLNY